MNGTDSFFLPVWRKSTPSGRCLSPRTQITGSPAIAADYLQAVVRQFDDSETDTFVSINLVQEIPGRIKDRILAELGVACSARQEAFVIEAGASISIYSPSPRGLTYGAMALTRLLVGSRLSVDLAYDSPVCETRGIKIYLPAPQDIDTFKRLIDMAFVYRYNTVVIEVGGAMQYLSHPEINSGWVEYCQDMNQYSDRSKEIQEKTFGWRKNSVHAENGGGQFLAQSVVAELVAYCKDRFMDVIPEMPSLSHCDYLLTRHPELSERVEDPYPDTCCPSNPATYQLLFDLLEEVIAVFQPETMHIGHDETYSIGLCPLCRDRDPAEIYASDITKIVDFLRTKNVRTMVWGDKFLDAYLPGYGPCGGARIEMHHPVTGAFSGVIPPTWRSIDLIPGDLRIMHWYWSVDSRLETEFLTRNLDTIYGNFSGPDIPDWIIRQSRGIRGAVISNWSALKDENLQRNGFFYNLAYSSVLFWHPDYEDSWHEQLNPAVLAELLRYRLAGLAAQPSDGLPRENGKWLEIVHTTDEERVYSPFVDGTFIDPEQDTLGHYILTYDDGITASVPIVYGHNISGQGASWERVLESDYTVYQTDMRLREVAFTTCPILQNGMTLYRFILANPYPESSLTGIQIRPAKPGCRLILRRFSLIDGLPE